MWKELLKIEKMFFASAAIFAIVAGIGCELLWSISGLITICLGACMFRKWEQ